MITQRTHSAFVGGRRWGVVTTNGAVADFTGNPCLVVRVVWPREVERHGHRFSFAPDVDQIVGVAGMER